MKIITHTQLVSEIDKFLIKRKVSAHNFGKKYFSDSGAVHRLRQGADPRLSTVIRLISILRGKSK